MMKTRVSRGRICIAIAAAAALAGCGAGGTSPALPPTHGTSTGASVPVKMSIVIAQPAGRAPLFVSPATLSAQVVVTPQGAASLPGTLLTCDASAHTCGGSVPAPVGPDSFAVKLYDRAGAAGNVLGEGTTDFTVVEGTANAIGISFNGVVASIFLAFSQAAVTPGTQAALAVTVSARDASSNIIFGAYQYPITLSNSDTSGATTLSTTTVGNRNQAVTLTYSGVAGFTGTTLSATAPNVPPANVTPAKLTVTAAGNIAYLTTTSAKTAGTISAGSAQAMMALISQAGDRNGMPWVTTTFTNGTGTAASSGRRPAALTGALLSRPRPAVESFPADNGAAWQHRLHLAPPGATRVPLAKRAASLGTSVGSTAKIWVDNSPLGSFAQSYIQVPSTLAASGVHGHIWVADSLLAASGGPISLSDATQIASVFDNAYDSDVAHFATPVYSASSPGMTTSYGTCGPTGAPDGGSAKNYVAPPSDGMFDVMVTDPAHLGAGVGGYFAALNFNPQSIANCFYDSTTHVLPESNEAPFIFIGFDISILGKPYVMQEDIVRSTSHEFQHLINFVNHAILPASTATPNNAHFEETFVNEGLSMLAQDFAVKRLYGGQGVNFDVDDAVYRALYFLDYPQHFSLSEFTGNDFEWAGNTTPTYNCQGGCYGSAYLFQRYLYDRFGGDTYSHGMETSDLTGYANLQQNGAGEPAASLQADFAMAMAANTLNLHPTDPRFAFGTLNLMATYRDQRGFAIPINGVGSVSLGGNASDSTLAAPLGGFAYASYTGIPIGGEPVSATDTAPGAGFGLLGGLLQR